MLNQEDPSFVLFEEANEGRRGRDKIDMVMQLPERVLPLEIQLRSFHVNSHLSIFKLPNFLLLSQELNRHIHIPSKHLLEPVFPQSDGLHRSPSYNRPLPVYIFPISTSTVYIVRKLTSRSIPQELAQSSSTSHI